MKKTFFRIFVLALCVMMMNAFSSFANNHKDTTWAAVWDTMLIKDWKYSKPRLKEDSSPVYSRVNYVSNELRGRKLRCSVVDSNFNSVFYPDYIDLSMGQSGPIYSRARGGDYVSHAVRLVYFIQSGKVNARGVWSPDSVGY